MLGDALEGREPAPPGFEIYARFCRAHRNTALAFVFSRTREALGDEWPTVVEAYFRAHPMFHVEINANGANFPSFLSGPLSELADFEWWQWQTRITAGTDQGLIAPTVEIRPYHSFGTIYVCFWRDRDDDVRAEMLSGAELRCLQSAFNGLTEKSPVADDLREAGILL